MRYPTCLVLSCAIAVFATGSLHAAPAALEPIMTERGAVLVGDTFESSLPKLWRGNIGQWEVAGGIIRGTEKKEQKHQAVLRRPVAFTNAIVAFSFRLGEARQISLSINDAKEHVCRLVINARGFVVQKDDHDHDGPDKPMVFARVPLNIS